MWLKTCLFFLVVFQLSTAAPSFRRYLAREKCYGKPCPDGTIACLRQYYYPSIDRDNFQEIINCLDENYKVLQTYNKTMKSEFNNEFIKAGFQYSVNHSVTVVPSGSINQLHKEPGKQIVE